MRIKKKHKKTAAYILMILAALIIMFNNTGQFLTFMNIPFTKSFQIIIGIVGFIIVTVWYLYLEKVIR